MRPFVCPNCRRLNHFEVRVCPHCRATLGYDPAIDQFRFLADDATTWRDREGNKADVVVCANNNRHGICNWLVEANDNSVPNGAMCRACRHNRTIPDLSQPSVPQRWTKIEQAKRRLFHTLLRLGLPLETKAEEKPGVQGLAFDFLYDRAAEQAGNPQVMTGHESGVVTLNLIEADDAERERIRHAMGEPYRTLLGHFRHEVGHHFWDRAVKIDAGDLATFRDLFGDERISYEEAREQHYGNGQNPVWTDDYVSQYAMMHPWEDWAETFAHYLHLVDVVATGRGFDLSMEAGMGGPEDIEWNANFDPFTADARTLADAMGPLAFAMNAMNRSMGLGDLYPFNLSDAIVRKLDFVQKMVAKARAMQCGTGTQAKARTEAA